MNEQDTIEMKAKRIMEWLEEESEEAYYQGSFMYDKYSARLAVLSHAKVLFSPDSYLSTESAADIWSRFARSTKLIFDQASILMLYIRFSLSGMLDDGLFSVDWSKATYLSPDIRKTMALMLYDKVAPDYITMTKKDDPLYEYYDSWRSTVAEIQDYIIKQEIPSIDEITPEGKLVFQTELNWHCIMTPRRDEIIKRILPSDILEPHHSVLWIDVSDTQKDVIRERRRLRKADSLCPLAFNLPDKKILEDFIENEIAKLPGKEEGGERDFLSSFIVFLKREGTDEKKVLKMLYNIRNGLSLFDLPLAVLKDGTESKKKVLDLVTLIYRQNKDGYIEKDVGFFSSNLTAISRLLHHFNALPISKDDELGNSRKKTWENTTSSIETYIVNLDQRCDTIDDYYTKTDYYWDRLFYPDND